MEINYKYLQESTWKKPGIHSGIVSEKHLGKSLVKHVCCPVGKSMYHSWPQGIMEINSSLQGNVLVTHFIFVVLTGLSRLSLWFQWCKVALQRFQFWAQLPMSHAEAPGPWKCAAQWGRQRSRAWEWASISTPLKTKDDPFASEKSDIQHWVREVLFLVVNCDPKKIQPKGNNNTNERQCYNSQDTLTL